MFLKHMNVALNMVQAALLIAILLVLGKPLMTKELGSPNQSEDLPFSWDRYLDPETPEFWDRGNHDGAPPRPMRYVAAYPTAENFQKLQEWQAKRTLYAFKNGGGIAKARFDYMDAVNEVKEELQQADSSINLTTYEPSFLVNWKNLEVIYIYRSSCLACQANTELLHSLTKKGVQITYLQTDSEEEKPLHPNSLPYKDYQSFFPHEATPTFYVKDGEKIMTFTGAMTELQFKQHIEQFWKEGEKSSHD